MRTIARRLDVNDKTVRRCAASTRPRSPRCRRARSPGLDAAVRHVAGFARMIKDLSGNRNQAIIDEKAARAAIAETGGD